MRKISKKIWFGLMGVIVGAGAGFFVVFGGGVASGFDDVSALFNSYTWNDVFAGDGLVAKDIYGFAQYKLNSASDDDATRELAQKYGLSRGEVEQVVGGSLQPVLNAYGDRVAGISQEEALGILSDMQDEYEILEETFALQNEIELVTGASEIFANGDLNDSGFDLIHDLEMLEEVLFVDKSETSIGTAYESGLDSPYLPTEEDNALADFVGGGELGDILSLGSALNPGDTGSEPGGFGDDEDFGETALSAPDVSESPFCSEDDPLFAALEDFEETVGGGAVSGGGVVSGGSAGGVGGSDGLQFGSELEDALRRGAIDEDGEIVPAPADDWSSVWCPVAEDTGDSDLALSVAVCVQETFTVKTLRSFNPGQSCVLCEVESINETMRGVLSHSLVPNKVTGNLLESAKCKEALSMSLVDLQFIAIASPVPTPSNDEIIFGKDPFDQWDKFIDRYEPILFEEAKFGTLFKRQAQAIPAGTSQQQLLDSVNSDLARTKAQAFSEIERISIANEGSNTKIFANTIAGEVAAMAAFFEKYQESYNEIVGLCQDTKSKDYIN